MTKELQQLMQNSKSIDYALEHFDRNLETADNFKFWFYSILNIFFMDIPLAYFYCAMRRRNVPKITILLSCVDPRSVGHSIPKL